MSQIIPFRGSDVYFSAIEPSQLVGAQSIFKVYCSTAQAVGRTRKLEFDTNLQSGNLD